MHLHLFFNKILTWQNTNFLLVFFSDGSCVWLLPFLIFCLLSALPVVLYMLCVPRAEPTNWMGSKGELPGGVCASSVLVGLI